ncbi:MAG: VanW family protein [Solirubrobacterales bacterium]
MKSKPVQFFLTGMVTLVIILMNLGNHSASPDKPIMPRVKTLSTESATPPGDPGSPAVPDKSGPISQAPWASDPRFQKAATDNGTPVQMAAFCTVLRDPLPGEENNVHLGADMLAGTVIQPGQIFSQNQTVGPYSSARGFQEGPVYLGARLSKTVGGGVCKLASTLYNVAVLSDLPIIERHFHSMPVPYVPYGQDATVCYGVKDIKFMNNTGQPIMIWAKGIENRLYIGFYGKKPAPQVTWHHDVLKSMPAPTVKRENPSLPENVQRRILPGMDGAVVRSSVTVRFPGGKEITRKRGTSWYAPFPEVIEQGTAPTGPE